MMKGIIFDCDGVLLDSEPLFSVATEKTMEALSLKGDPSLLPDSYGITVPAFARIFLDAFPQNKISIEEFIEVYYRCTDEILMADDLQPMEGLKDFVRKQYARGMKLAVASSSPLYYVTHKLDLFGIRECFDFIVSANDVSHSKPHPEVYLKAIQKTGEKAEDLIAIEDAPNGIRSAKTAGLYTVGFKGSKILQDTSAADEEVYRFSDIKVLE